MVPSTRKISTSGGTSVVSTRANKAVPCRVRALAGIAGAAAGLINVSTNTYSRYRLTSAMPGSSAPLYMSPTEVPSWSARMINTSEGGMICASVPDAAMTPEASRLS